MRRVIHVLLGMFVVMVALAGRAAAHVTVTAPGAEPGSSDVQVTFQVPVEKDVATTGFTVVLPTDTPIASVDVKPLPGWTTKTTSAKLSEPIKTDDGEITEAVSEITWTAARGQGLKPGEFGAFTILAGALPDTPSLTFKAIQRYADGSEVRWIETAAPGSQNEPEHPAPVLTLTAATHKTGSDTSNNTGPIILSIVAVVLAAAALGVAIVGRARRGSP